jgi:hypothetical protein
MLNQQIGAFETKPFFSQIIEPEMTRQEAFEKIKELRKRYSGKHGSFNIREAIEDGRK